MSPELRHSDRAYWLLLAKFAAAIIAFIALMAWAIYGGVR